MLQIVNRLALVKKMLNKAERKQSAKSGYVLDDDDEKLEGKEPITSTLIQHELNFFEFETKMRKVMFDIIQPNVNKTNAQNIQIVELEKQLNKANLEIQVCIFHIFYAINIYALIHITYRSYKNFCLKANLNNKQSTLDEIYIKIADIEKDRKMEEANMMFELHKFDK